MPCPSALLPTSPAGEEKTYGTLSQNFHCVQIGYSKQGKAPVPMNVGLELQRCLCKTLTQTPRLSINRRNSLRIGGQHGLNGFTC